MAFAKVEDQRLSYLRNHQKDLHAEKYRSFAERMREDPTQKIGKRVILPASHVGSRPARSTDHTDLLRIFRILRLYLIEMTHNIRYLTVRNRRSLTHLLQLSPKELVYINTLHLKST